MAEGATLVVLPALILGAVIGLIELLFVHADEAGMGWFGHGLHALPFTMLFTFANMNVSYVLPFLPGALHESFWVVLGVRAVIAIIGMLKIAGAAAIAGKVGERFYHTIIIGAIIFAAPYLWDFVLKPMGILPTLF